MFIAPDNCRLWVQRQGLCFPRASFGSGGEGFSGLWGGLAAHVVLSLNFISSYSEEKACHYTFFEKLNHCQWPTFESLVSNGSQDLCVLVAILAPFRLHMEVGAHNAK